MEPPNPGGGGGWSDLPPDLLRSIFKRLSFAHFHRAKIVCSNWNTSSKQTVPRKGTTPWLMLFPKGNDGCVLYNPDEEKVYKTTNREFPGLRFLGSSGNWFLVLDSRSKLYIINVFSGNRIDLPPLESLRRSDDSILERAGAKVFKLIHPFRATSILRAEDLRGLLWVDEKTKEFVVVWFFDNPYKYLAFCKKGDDHYSDIPLHKEFRGLVDMVLRGYRLYMALACGYIQFLDLPSGRAGGVEDVTQIIPSTVVFLPWHYRTSCGIAVTTSGEVLLVKNNLEKISIESNKSFCIYRCKMDPNAIENPYEYLEVDSLGDEALLLDLGITVPANYSLGIEPNSIYFAGQDHVCLWKQRVNPDICVFNLATKTLKRFPRLFNMNLKDARWVLPGI